MGAPIPFRRPTVLISTASNFDLQTGLRALHDVESARNACWTEAEALHLAGHSTDDVDDEAAACDEAAERLRGLIVAAIEKATGLSADQLREALQ